MRFLNPRGQSATELAIFGSILIFIVAMIFRQGFSAGNFMNSQLKAERLAMSKSLEMSVSQLPGRNTAATLVIEDRLAGDFNAKTGSRDRTPVISAGSASFSNQLFYPIDAGDFPNITNMREFYNSGVLPVYDVWVNGQRFSFTTAAFVTYTIPQVQGSLSVCEASHPNDTRCWRTNCFEDPPGTWNGCVVLHRIVENYPGSGYEPAQGGFDYNFDGIEDVPVGDIRLPVAQGSGRMSILWQWREVPALGDLTSVGLLDVDGDFKEEQILSSTFDPLTNRTTSVNVIDRQEGDIDFTLDDRSPGVQIGLQDESQMFSFTQQGTFYRIEEGKLLNPSNGQFIRNTNRNDQIDIIQRVFKLSNNTGNICSLAGVPQQPDVEACNQCFSSTNVQRTCFDAGSLQLFIRSRVANEGGRRWFTKTDNP